MKCRICASDNVRFALKFQSLSGRIWDIYECRRCLVRFIYPIPSPKELERVYDQSYRQSDMQAKTLNNPRYGWLTFRRQGDVIRSLVHRKHGRIVDFGCGGGHFLDNIDPGWEKYGIDVSEDARKVATQKGIKIFATLEEAAFPDGFFDVVVMFAIIEHLPDPRDVVRELTRVSKSGGLFVIMTGDVTSLKARIKAEKWHMYCPPEHLYFFSAQSLGFLMDSLGFEKIKTLYTDGGMTQIPFGPLNMALRISLMIYETIPILNSLPLFDHYYGYYQKR